MGGVGVRCGGRSVLGVGGEGVWEVVIQGLYRHSRGSRGFSAFQWLYMYMYTCQLRFLSARSTCRLVVDTAIRLDCSSYV